MKFLFEFTSDMLENLAVLVWRVKEHAPGKAKESNFFFQNLSLSLSLSLSRIFIKTKIEISQKRDRNMFWNFGRVLFTYERTHSCSLGEYNGKAPSQFHFLDSTLKRWSSHVLLQKSLFDKTSRVYTICRLPFIEFRKRHRYPYDILWVHVVRRLWHVNHFMREWIILCVSESFS